MVSKKLRVKLLNNNKEIFMRYILLFISLFLGLFSSFQSYAGGGIAHMFVADGTLPYLSDYKLRNLLQDNRDAYLTGAHYPDSGFVPGTGYGEDSHWDPFVFTFADYIKEKYPNPELQNPKLVAFLMGCAVHRVSDEIMHFIFYNYISEQDFNHNDFKAHKYGDVGIDLLLNIEKNRWTDHPKVWWVPVNDLLEVYHRMGLDQYTANQIIYGNKVLNLAGYLERAISIPSYTYLRLRMPWTAQHYYDWPEGGLLMNIQSVSVYQNNLWNRLKQSQAILPHKPIVTMHDTSLLELSKQALDDNMANVDIKYNTDGSVELQQPIIIDQNRLTNKVLKNILN
jgi:hypothetical protein